MLVNPASDYLNSVMTLESYFLYFFPGIVFILIFIWLKFNPPYIAWITGETMAQSAHIAVSKSRTRMTALQIGFTVLAGILFIFAPYLGIRQHESNALHITAVLSALGCLFANVICFILFLIRERGIRKSLVLPGIRNTLLIPPAFLVSMVHKMGWVREQGNKEFTRYDIWSFEYLGYALAFSVLVIILFTVIEAAMGRHRK